MEEKFFKIFFAVVLVLVVVFAIIGICVFLKYANTPASELPLWVIWLLFSGD